MSLPIQTTRSEGSFHGSSQYAIANDIQDTATSMSRSRTMLGSATAVSSKPLNAAYQKGQSRGRSCSVLPIMRCVWSQ